MGTNARHAETPAPVFLLGTLIAGVALALQSPPLWRPMLRYDDFPILVESWTWADVRTNLWRPFNEHVMPLGRVSTWALAHLATGPTALPALTARQGPLALGIALVLLYLFVRRELGRPFPGLAAMAVFGVSSVYLEAVTWFASSFSVLALDTMLLGLLAAQRWRQTGRPYHLALSAFWALLAPAWFASGILAGPLCCLYLLPRDGDDFNRGWRRLTALVPLLGSAAFLAVSLPRNADPIMHLEHYQGKTLVQAFDPLTGLRYTARSLVDNLLLGAVGISGVTLPPVLTGAGLGVLGAAAVWWWRRTPRRRLLLLGLGMILASDLLIYSARATWSYDLQVHAWLRYNLLPQLGLTLFICGGLPPFRGQYFAPRDHSTPLLALFFLFLLQLPRALIISLPQYEPEQMQVLRQIDAVDARCREHHIDAATARRALAPLYVPDCGTDSNGWKLLRGSDDPRPVSLDEARRLLQP